jgi:lantibiotic transport system permease protein
MNFVNAFIAEWLKKRRSLADWLVVVGGFFTPALIIVARLINPDRLATVYASPGFWPQLWKNSWESMAVFFLPMGAILATSLITQIEFKNNAWKQLHALPIGVSTIFFSKLAVVMVMMVQFFILFNIGIYLSAVVPAMLLRDVPYPTHAIPLAGFARDNVRYFAECLPIVGAQYMISLHFRNFLVPVGVGFMTWVGALAALPWRFNYLVPYSYCTLHFLEGDTRGKAAVPPYDIDLMAIAYFALFVVAGFILFATKREKG